MATTETTATAATIAAARRWTTTDLEGFPEPLDGTRYEIIYGELHVSTQPSYHHQTVCGNALRALEEWNEQTGAGHATVAPGVVFSPSQAVAPDVVWVSAARLPAVLGEDGKLHAAPDLVVEVLSPGSENETRDRDTKLLV